MIWRLSMLIALGCMVAIGVGFVGLNRDEGQQKRINIKRCKVFSIEELCRLIEETSNVKVRCHPSYARLKVFISDGTYKLTALLQAVTKATNLSLRKVGEIYYLAPESLKITREKRRKFFRNQVASLWKRLVDIGAIQCGRRKVFEVFGDKFKERAWKVRYLELSSKGRNYLNLLCTDLRRIKRKEHLQIEFVPALKVEIIQHSRKGIQINGYVCF